MRLPEEIYGELESQRAAREEEVRRLDNLVSGLDRERGALTIKALTRSKVVLAYAHLEGFTKFALEAFIVWLNGERYDCGELRSVLVATLIRSEFKRLHDPLVKHPSFRTGIRVDDDVSDLFKRAALVDGLRASFGNHYELKGDVLDLKSNLSSKVLKRNLYALGIDYALDEETEKDIDIIVNLRNAISHGDFSQNPDDPSLQFEPKLREAAFRTMKSIQLSIFSTMNSEAVTSTT